MTLLQPVRLGAAPQELRRLSHAGCRDRRRSGLRQAGPRGRPALHHQDHGRQDAVAGRHRHRHASSRSPTASRRSSRRCRISTSCAAIPSPASRWCSSTSRTACARARCPTCGTRCARRSTTSARHLPSGHRTAPSSTTSSATPTRIIYALTSDGFSQREVRDHAERVRAELLRVPDVAKVDLIGAQDEKIYLEFSTQQVAALGHRHQRADPGAAGAERRGAERRRRCGPRAHRHPRLRRVHLGRAA